MIKPTIGRIVHLHTNGNQVGGRLLLRDLPAAAIVTHVNERGNEVRLAAFTHDANCFPCWPVPFIQEGEPTPPHGQHYATWPARVDVEPTNEAPAANAAVAAGNAGNDTESTASPTASADAPSESSGRAPGWASPPAEAPSAQVQEQQTSAAEDVKPQVATGSAD